MEEWTFKGRKKGYYKYLNKNLLKHIQCSLISHNFREIKKGIEEYSYFLSMSFLLI